jgi:hypothetical protein
VRNVLQSPPTGCTTAVRQLLVTITLVLAVMFSALVQTTAAPDFSGSWVLNAAKSKLPKDSTIKPQTIVMDNKKSAIVFHYKTDDKKSMESYTPDEASLAEHVVRSTDFERELARLGAGHRIQARYKGP